MQLNLFNNNHSVLKISSFFFERAVRAGLFMNKCTQTLYWKVVIFKFYSSGITQDGYKDQPEKNKAQCAYPIKSSLDDWIQILWLKKLSCTMCNWKFISCKHYATDGYESQPQYIQHPKSWLSSKIVPIYPGISKTI
jgi:hypothetical protein